MRLFLFVLTIPMMIAGWRAWTGRWRTWAHPYAGFGVIPVLLLPLGFGMFWLLVASSETEDPPWWAAILGLPGAIAFFLSVANMFYDPKRWPRLLKPPWISPDAPVPVFIDPRTNLARMAGGRVDDSSEARAGQAAAGAGKRLAHWYAAYLEETPEMPYLNTGLPGLRWARLDVYEEAVAVYQRYMEDRLRSANLVFVFRPGDVEKVEFIPAPALSWRHFTGGRKHLAFPRVRIHTRGGAHEIGLPDGKFKRHIERGLAVLAKTLQVQVVR
jgi:hypothetical protein